MPNREQLRCAQVVKIYRSASGEVQALQGVDAAFQAASLTAVTGPSGSGKSSLLAVIALRESPTGGGVWLQGQDALTLSPAALRVVRRREVAWMAQRPTHSLFAHLSAEEMLIQLAHQRGCPDTSTPAARRRLERLGLLGRARAHTRELSGGEQQRLAVAAVVVGVPALVVVDEPTAELDDASADLVLAELTRSARAGSCVVVATHDKQVVRRADRHLHLRHGVLSEDREGSGPAAVAIDTSGRLQLSEAALALFPNRRVIIEHHGDGVRLRPVPTQEDL